MRAQVADQPEPRRRAQIGLEPDSLEDRVGREGPRDVRAVRGRGMDRGELELHYLPKVVLADGRTGGMEALVRWRHPRLGMIMPADFIPATEQSCLMRDLTVYVVDAAVAQAARWRRDGLPVQVSVNLSARDLLDGGLAEMVGRGLHQHGLPPGVAVHGMDSVLREMEPAVQDARDHEALGVAASLVMGAECAPQPVRQKSKKRLKRRKRKRVISQSPAAGETVQPGTGVTLVFRR